MPHETAPAKPGDVCPDPAKGEVRFGVMGRVTATGRADGFWLMVVVASPRGATRQAWMHRSTWRKLRVEP
jgi:hypothetical protein